MIKSPYLKRLAARRQARQLENLAAFGVVGGGLLVLFACFRLIYINDGLEILWYILGTAGFILAVVGFVLPPALGVVLRAYRMATNFIGKWVFEALLVGVYFLAITPVGWWMRRRTGSAPFYAWTDHPPVVREGWTAKQVDVGLVAAQDQRRSIRSLLLPLEVFTYFIRYRRFVFLPVLVLLISLGLLMFFISTSSLAPLIYTLF